MAIQNGIILAPVNIYDLQQMLNTDEPDLCALIRSGLVNRFAKYKPVRAATKKFIHYLNRRDVNFGLVIPFCRWCLMNELANDILTGSDTGWDYEIPRGKVGETEEPFRLTDFVPYPYDDYNDTQYDPSRPNWLIRHYGYNHNAAVPFRTEIVEQEGVDVRIDNTEYIIEVNNQAARYFAVNIVNSNDDLCLQDFLDGDDGEDNPTDVAWRPVLQFFIGGWENNDQNTGHWQNWYERERVDYQIAGSKIKTARGNVPSVRVDLTNSFFVNHPAPSEIHMCIGIAKCSREAEIRYDSLHNAVFLMPYERNEYNEPLIYNNFHFKIKMTSHFPRIVTVRKLWVYGVVDTNLSPTDSDGAVSQSIWYGWPTGNFVVGFEISKSQYQAFHFIDNTIPLDSGYTSLVLTAVEQIRKRDGTTVERRGLQLYPTMGMSSGERWQKNYHAHVDIGNSTDTVMLYAACQQTNIASLGAGETAEYLVSGSINGVEPIFNDNMFGIAVYREDNV